MKIGILWDLDGTLLDTLDDLTDAANYALTQFGYPMRTREEVRQFVGNGAAGLIRQAVPEGVDDLPVFQRFREFYGANCQVKTKPYPGILDALQALSWHPMAIVSNKPDGAVKELCALHFPGILARGERADCPRKPAPDMIYQAMAEIGVDTCIYVGDSDVDVIAARNAEVPCLSVLWGFRNRAEIEASGGKTFCEKTELLAQTLEEMIRGLTQA